MIVTTTPGSASDTSAAREQQECRGAKRPQLSWGPAVDLTALFLNYEPPGQVMRPTSDADEIMPVRPVRRVDRLGQQKALELMALYLEGLSVSQLASQYGVNITTVRNQLKAAEVELRPFLKLSPDQITEAGRLREGGASLVALANRFGVSTSTIKRVLVESGVS
jgi:transposase-like protein